VKTNPEDNEFAELRRRAEEKIRSATRKLRDNLPHDLKTLVHELETHQVELEMQNEELRRARQDLEKSQREYADLYDFAPTGYFLLDRNGVVRSTNYTGAQVLGYDKHNLLDVPFSTFVVKGDWELFFAHLRDVFDRQVRQVQELCIRAANLAILHVQLQSVTAEDRESGALSCRMAVIDITERRRIEEALQAANDNLEAQAEQLQTVNEALRRKRHELEEANEYLRTQEEELRRQAAALHESERRFRSLAESTFEGICLSEHGRIRDCNEQFAQLLGYSRDELIGRTVGLGDTEEGREEVLSNILLGRETVADYELPGRGERRRTVEAHSRTSMDRGQILRITALRDVTERKQAEVALRESNTILERKVADRAAELAERARQLQKLTREQSQAEDRERKRVAEILHDDLQQQLAAVKFHLNLLRGRAGNDPSQQAIITEIDRILDGAVRESRRLSHELSPAVLYHGDLRQVLECLADELHTKHGLVVHVQAGPEVRPQVEAVTLFLFRAAQELLFNVIKHARVNETWVRIRRRGRYLGLSVRDRGRGFDPGELRETPGFGLFSIRERLELLGGRLSIRSAEGQGSRCRIVVLDAPKSEDTAGVGPRAHPTSATPDGHRGPPLRVLLADDHEVMREGLALLLREQDNIEVVGEAANGREAINLACRLRPDVVVLDVGMPLISGDEATRQIKRNLPQTRVIALSMHNEPETAASMYQAGAEGYVLKTAPSEELLAAIRGPKPDAGSTESPAGGQ